ncbi:winged helix-turn-helix domain-containing protein [Catellatospora methionotrophica]|uniref:winged helix-turn-helix domain-containing protein n=1 Tax=Catellatospora methionotrophica TaxID=121620 RepID=UPI0033E54599
MPAIPMSSAQIAADITARIKSGEYQPGQQLPTIAAFADLYGVSDGTISRVMIVLRTQGTVIGVPGRGTFVPEQG